MLVPRRGAHFLLELLAYLDPFVAGRVPAREVPDPDRRPTLEQLATEAVAEVAGRATAIPGPTT